MLLPYDPAFKCDGFDEDRSRLAYHLEKAGIALREVAVLLHGDISEQLRPHVNNVQVIWTLLEPAAMVNIKKLVQLCNAEGIALLTSELASVFQGAALGFGESGSLLGA